MGLRRGRRYWALHGLFAAAGTLAALFLVFRGLSPVVASGLVGVVVSLGLITWGEERHFSIAAFTGSFAGMTARELLPDAVSVTGLVLATALLFALSERLTAKKPHWTYDGFGGRLGTIALISVLLVLGIGTVVRNFPEAVFWRFTWNLPVEILWWGIPTSALGAGVAWAVKQGLGSLNSNHRVLAIALTGLLGAILFPCFLGLWVGREVSDPLVILWYAGAFAGMSSADILPGRTYFVAAGSLTGVICPIILGFWPGAGGRLGFAAFLAVLMIRGLAVLRHKKPEAAPVNKPLRFRPRVEQPLPANRLKKKNQKNQGNGPTRT